MPEIEQRMEQKQSGFQRVPDDAIEAIMDCAFLGDCLTCDNRQEKCEMVKYVRELHDELCRALTTAQQNADKLARVEQVVAKAIAWWESHRPCVFSESEHLENPDINTTSKSGKELALAIGEYLSATSSPNWRGNDMAKIPEWNLDWKCDGKVHYCPNCHSTNMKWRGIVSHGFPTHLFECLDCGKFYDVQDFRKAAEIPNPKEQPCPK